MLALYQTKWVSGTIPLLMDDVEKVREKIDIVAFISEYIPLKKTGSHFKALCPFHTEKTPSFIVSPERQIWRCFGCGLGGDCFSFLMQYENIEFPEALRILAKRAGVILAQTAFQKDATSKREKLFVLNKLSLDFYHYILLHHNAGKKALSYLLEERKIKAAAIKTFQLGFSPGIGNSLSQYLMTKKSYKAQDLFEAGISLQRGGRAVDFFVNRIMFPLHDHRGNVIGFAGRIFEEKDNAVAKYVNTRETPVYHKGEVFFGLNLAKDAIKKKNEVLIMEGEFDVVSSFQEGINNAIAIKGTALTEHQVNLLGRFTSKVILCFDEDKAGQNALKRSLPILEKKGLSVYVAASAGKDPDEAVKNDPIAFKKSVQSAVSVYDYLLAKTLTLFNAKTAEGKKQIGDAMLPIFAGIDNEIVKEHYLRQLASALDTSFDSILRQVEKFANPVGVALAITEKKEKRIRQETVEEYLLALLLQHVHKKEAFEKIAQKLIHVQFITPAYKKIFDLLLSYYGNATAFDSTKFTSLLPLELFAAFDVCYLLPLPVFANKEKEEEEITKMLEELIALSLKTRIKALGETIKEKEKAAPEAEELQALKGEFSRLAGLLATQK